MALFKLLFGWPLAPIHLLARLGELIQDQVELQLHDPAAVRRQLEDLEEARAAGLISEEEAESATDEILERMLSPKGP